MRQELCRQVQQYGHGEKLTEQVKSSRFDPMNLLDNFLGCVVEGGMFQALNDRVPDYSYRTR